MAVTGKPGRRRKLRVKKTSLRKRYGRAKRPAQIAATMGRRRARRRR